MKKSIFNILAVAFAGLSFSACQSEFKAPDANATHTVVFSAEQVVTKTGLSIDGETVHYAWKESDTEGDKFKVFENGVEADLVVPDLKDGKMSIIATFPGEEAPVSAKYLARFNSGVNASQYGDETEYAQDSDVLVSEEAEGDINDEGILFRFTRVSAFGQMTLKNLGKGEFVNSVKIETTDGKILAAEYDFANNQFAAEGSATLNIETLSTIANNQAVVRFVTVPVQDAMLKITATTIDGDENVVATYEKTFTKSISFSAGDLFAFGALMEESAFESQKYVKVTSTSDLTDGKYLIVYETASVALNGALTSDVVSNTVAVSINEGEIESSNEIDAAAVTYNSADGSFLGGSGKYIGHTGTSNTLNYSDNALANVVTFDNGNAVITAGNYVMRYNSASNQNRFRYYTSGQQAIQLYKFNETPTPAKTLTSLAISGTPTKTEYYVGDAFDPAGLVVTGTYDDGSQATVSSGITWTVDPEKLAATTTSVSVTAIVGEISSDAYTVTGLNVTTRPVSVNLNNTFYGINTGNNSIEQTKTTDEGITIVSGCNSSATSKTYYDSGHIRYYAGSYLKVSVDGTISKIVFTADGTWNDDEVSVNTGTYENKVWTGSASEIVFNFAAQCRISSIDVTFIIDTTPKFNVSCNTVDGGVLSASPSRATSGTVITLTATPDDEYTFNNDWSVRGDDNTSIIVTNGTFTLPEQNVTVLGSFTKKTYAITKNEAENGTYTVTDKDGISVTSASKGDKITLTASPSEGYILDRWEVKNQRGESVSVSNNTFYMPASAVSISAYFVAEAAVPEYASLEDLVAAELSSGTTVKVSFENVPIKSIYVTGKDYRNGIYFDIQKGGKDIEIYYQNVPDAWVAGGTVSGTMTCPWKNYNGTWELAPEQDTWDWNNLTYKAPCATPVITLDGANASISCATTGATILYEISDTEPASFTNTYSSAVTLTDGQTIWAKATLAGQPDSEVAYKKYTAGTIFDPINISWTRSGTTDTVTSGYKLTTQNYSSKSGYYQDGSSTTKLKLTRVDASTALFTTAPSSITFTASIGGGSAKNPLGNAVIVYLVDASGNEISGTRINVTTKVESTSSGTNYTVNIPVVSTAYGVEMAHTKESNYNVRFFGASFSAK